MCRDLRGALTDSRIAGGWQAVADETAQALSDAARSKPSCCALQTVWAMWARLPVHHHSSRLTSQPHVPSTLPDCLSTCRVRVTAAAQLHILRPEPGLDGSSQQQKTIMAADEPGRARRPAKKPAWMNEEMVLDPAEVDA